jgi:uncharacterized membrane protein YgcG
LSFLICELELTTIDGYDQSWMQYENHIFLFLCQRRNFTRLFKHQMLPLQSTSPAADERSPRLLVPRAYRTLDYFFQLLLLSFEHTKRSKMPKGGGNKGGAAGGSPKKGGGGAKGGGGGATKSRSKV